ncbi:hypothetical protein GcM1_164012 [Golovinomyces cichoracearum]|uniref:Uncharacterized protein n=1 Tax=Golovinomyces cichoracearum TaxID=62708 RepID=A0A420J8B7_9PEZI|nr:hypothetical protein GcM1_164012 [Golovinomyces cichoracearum]
MITIMRNLVCGSSLSKPKPPIELTLQTIGSDIRCGYVKHPVYEIDDAAKKACEWAIEGQSCVSKLFCRETGSLYKGTDDDNTNEHQSVIHRVKNRFSYLKGM